MEDMQKYIPEFEEFINESINDKNLLKAIFIVGSGGSGKSYILEKVFPNLSVKILNPDYYFERDLKKYGYSFDINNLKGEEYDKATEIRDKAKTKATLQSRSRLNSLIPIILDRTGKYEEEIEEYKVLLEKLGYDTSMIFVAVDLETALARNQLRDRKVPEDKIKTAWIQVNAAHDFYKRLFGANFYEINNNNTLEGEAQLAFESKLHKIGMKLLQSPLRNQIGRDLLELIKEVNGKYRSDVDLTVPSLVHEAEEIDNMPKIIFR